MATGLARLRARSPKGFFFLSVFLSIAGPSFAIACGWELLPFRLFPPALKEPVLEFLEAAESYMSVYRRKVGLEPWKVHQNPVAAEIASIVESYQLLKDQREGYFETEGIRTSPDYADHPSSQSDWDHMIAESSSSLRDSLEEKTPLLLQRIFALRFDRTQEFFMDIFAEQANPASAIACSQLMEMYIHFANQQGYQLSLVAVDHYYPRGSGARSFVNHAVLHFYGGSKSYEVLRHEAGIHKFISYWETKRHTSRIRVSVFPVPNKELFPDFLERDVRTEFTRSGGPGGQGVNKTESAVRVTHIPTGISVVIENERSQAQNRTNALKILKARVLLQQKEAYENELRARKTQAVVTATRFVRTYHTIAAGGTVTDETGVTARFDDLQKGDMGEFLIRVDEERKPETLRKLTAELKYLTKELEKQP